MNRRKCKVRRKLDCLARERDWKEKHKKKEKGKAEYISIIADQSTERRDNTIFHRLEINNLRKRKKNT